MEIPAELQERTNILFQELQSELGKHSANQFVLMRTAIHFKDNESSVINPQELMNTDSSSIEDLWDRYVSSPPADDSDPSVRHATSNKDLDEILSQLGDSIEPVDSTDGVSYRPNTPLDSRNFFEAN
jgi:hypothetical protein